MKHIKKINANTKTVIKQIYMAKINMWFWIFLLLNTFSSQVFSQNRNIMNVLYANCEDDSLFIMKLGINVYEKILIEEDDLLKPDRSGIDSMIFYSEDNVLGPIADRIFYNWYKIVKRDTIQEKNSTYGDDAKVIVEYVKLTALEDYKTNFDVDFPKGPRMSINFGSTSSMGIMKVQAYESIDEKKGLFYGVSTYKLPSSIISMFNQEPFEREGFLKGKIGGFAYETQQEIIKVDNDNSNSFFGRKFELQGENNGLITIGRLLLVNQTVYFITASSETGGDYNDLIYFVESFRLR